MNPFPTAITAGASRGERQSARLSFLMAGTMISAWAPLVPLTKARAGLDEAELGLLLLLLGIGSISAMPFSGYLSARYGCRPVIIWSVVALCCTFPFLGTVAWMPALIAAVFVFGASIGMLDCTMNIQSVIVEKNSGEALQSGFHGLYSVGGIVGAGAMVALLSLGLTPLLASFCIVALVLVALVKAAPSLLPYGAEHGRGLSVMPRGIVAFIGALCFIVFLAEGAMLDWSAVFLVSSRNMDPSMAGLGYACFAAAMTIARLTGDAVVTKLGGQRVICYGGICAAAGLLLSLIIADWEVALLGYALIGVGAANIVPVLFTAAGRQAIMPQGAAITSITSMGYAGILVGPAFIGMAAQWVGLASALGVIVLMLLFVSASARVIKG